MMSDDVKGWCWVFALGFTAMPFNIFETRLLPMENWGAGFSPRSMDNADGLSIEHASGELPGPLRWKTAARIFHPTG
ncbi:hypothetical protein FHR87_002258 [Azomonas macrocytogenes]|uniref:Uncharacterized protein n=1 Tax=Azomonas macrocytogenes TaxID=69962 RepID=A0A839T430_AZOMA|nr:hypothetical protein [Azomonas macrocytogenes]